MILGSVTVGPFAENCYLVGDPEARVAVLVDPGDEPDRIADMVARSGCQLQAIWLTHAHLDHIGALAAIKRIRDVPVYLHPADRPLFDNADRQAAWYGLPFDTPDPPDAELAEGDVLAVGSVDFRVLHTPGHAPGHVIFVGDQVILGGDLLFMDSIGRTDLPLSSPAAMVQSLERLSLLNENLAVHPGHGPSTTLKREFMHNPFLNGAARVIGG
jgi:glyoxylase-like metal-dependent hydrolase (beta-lactamase superfamily II)